MWFQGVGIRGQKSASWKKNSTKKDSQTGCAPEIHPLKGFIGTARRPFRTRQTSGNALGSR